MEHPLVRICVADVFFFLFCFLCQWGGKVWPFRWLYGRHFPSGGRNPHNGICRIGITKFLLNGWFSLGILNSCSGLISNILGPFLGFLMFFFSFLLGLLRDSFENCQWFVSGPPTSSKIVANWLTVLKESLLFIHLFNINCWLQVVEYADVSNKSQTGQTKRKHRVYKSCIWPNKNRTHNNRTNEASKQQNTATITKKKAQKQSYW